MITVNDDKEREKRSILAIVILALVRLVLGYVQVGIIVLLLMKAKKNFVST